MYSLNSTGVTVKLDYAILSQFSFYLKLFINPVNIIDSIINDDNNIIYYFINLTSTNKLRSIIVIVQVVQFQRNVIGM